MRQYLLSAKLGMLLGELVVWITSLLLIAVAASADDKPRVLVPCAVKEVHDGDTIIVDVEFPWGVSLRDQTVRFQEFDAWEVTKTRQTVKVTDAEIAKGVVARNDLQMLLQRADVVYLSPGDTKRKDPYGRLPAYPFVWYGEKLIDVGDWMRQRGHERK